MTVFHLKAEFSSINYDISLIYNTAMMTTDEVNSGSNKRIPIISFYNICDNYVTDLYIYKSYFNLINIKIKFKIYYHR